MTANINNDIEPNLEETIRKTSRKKTTVAIILSVILLVVGVIVFVVGGIGAIFMTDSCSGDSIGTVWEIWVVIAWPLLMLAGSLLPSFLYIKNNGWPVIAVTILICAVINTAWYFALGPVLTMAGC